MDIIAEHTFEIRYPNGSVKQAHVKFERPSPHPAGGGDWGCVAHMEGDEIMGRPKVEIFGDGSLQALMLATKFV